MKSVVTYRFVKWSQIVLIDSLSLMDHISDQVELEISQTFC